MAVDEDKLRSLIQYVANTPKDSEQSVVDVLLSDVLEFDAWYGSDSFDEIQFDSGATLKELLGSDMKRKQLTRIIESYVADNSGGSADTNSIVLAIMDRIVNWQQWLPAANGMDNFKAYEEERRAYEDAYYGSDGYGDENGLGDFSGF